MNSALIVSDLVVRKGALSPFQKPTGHLFKRLTKSQSVIYGLATLPRYNQYCRPAGVVADGYCMDIEKNLYICGRNGSSAED